MARIGSDASRVVKCEIAHQTIAITKDATAPAAAPAVGGASIRRPSTVMPLNT
jgi:hypothetical protein